MVDLNKKLENTGLSLGQVYIEDPVERMFDDIFEEVNEDFQLKFGDISPGQYMEIKEMERKLIKILKEYVHQNQPYKP